MLLPKFHFILPNFYFPPRWRIFVSSVTDLDFLRREWLEAEMYAQQRERERERERKVYYQTRSIKNIIFAYADRTKERSSI